MKSMKIILQKKTRRDGHEAGDARLPLSRQTFSDVSFSPRDYWFPLTKKLFDRKLTLLRRMHG